jgi:2-polyprenyl-3-methyl-5-hydroxy-6-metoxy-1,4-benzoquinol methylase
MDGYLSAADTEALTASCDCYVSLHRSEGFGLTMAEAMAHGKPVIATRYSGNLEYMTPETSLLVPYRLTPIPTGIEPYPAGTEWAEPDVTVAAQLMRRVYESPDEAARIGGRAKNHVAERLSPDRTGEFIKARLAEIGKRRSVGGRAPNLQIRPSGVAHASRYLSDGPSNPIRGPSRFGFLGRLARRGVYRILRPYTTRHAEFETAVVDALQELDDRLQDLDTRVSDARKRSFAERARLERHARDLSQHMNHLERHARDLSQHVNRVDRDSAALGGQLYATPFMTDPQYFRTTSPDGEEALGYSGQGEPPTVSGSYRDFEDVFRGPEKLILERQRAFVGVVARHEPVLDVGCGRGEFLDLLRDAGIDGRGVDVNEDMVEHCRAKGHRVELAEATEYLAGQADETFGAIFSAQVIEHLPYERLLRFFELVRAKLAPGGILVAETVNPHSLSALKTFWVDLTHEKPIFPEVALALCRVHGFESAQVFFPNGSGELERDRREQGEYAVIATVALVQPGDAEAISTGEASATSQRFGRS